MSPRHLERVPLDSDYTECFKLCCFVCTKIYRPVSLSQRNWPTGELHV